MTTPWILRTVTPDANHKKTINEEGYGFQLVGTGHDGVRVRLYSRDQGVDENQLGARSLLPMVGEVVPGEFAGLEVEWPDWNNHYPEVQLLIYKQPLVSAVASPDPRAALTLHKFLDFNNHTAMGGNLAVGATATVFDWYEYLQATGSGDAGPQDVTALGEGSSWMAAEGYLLPVMGATGTADITVYAYTALVQASTTRLPWFRASLIPASTNFPASLYTHYWQPYFGSGNMVPWPPNGCFIQITNTSAGTIQWDCRLYTRAGR